MNTQNDKKLHQETLTAFKGKIKAFDKNIKHVSKLEIESVLDKLERSSDRLYNNQCLSLEGYKSLLDMILNRREKHIFDCL